MIAILIFSMGVLAIVGLQAAMIKNTADSKYRAEASYIAQKRIGQMWADPDPILPATSGADSTDISASLPWRHTNRQPSRLRPVPVSYSYGYGHLAATGCW